MSLTLPAIRIGLGNNVVVMFETWIRYKSDRVWKLSWML